MDQMQFDTLTRRLSRRTGVLGAIGAMLGLVAAPATDAARKATRRHEKLACRNANSQCTADDECCSGSCVPKLGGTEFRCAKRHANKKKEDDKGGDGPGPVSCTVCASGCPYTTIEDAVADASSGDTITVGPGTYIPALNSGDTYGAIRIDQDLTLKACDPNNPPTVTGSADFVSTFLFSIGNVDEQYTCNDEQPTVVFDGINLEGGAEPLFGAIFVLCDVTWTLRNAEVQDFLHAGFLGYPPLMLNSGNGVIDACSIHDNDPSGGNDSGPSAILLFRQIEGAPPRLEIRDSTVSNNTGLYGAIGVYGFGSLTLSGSTSITNNTATGGGAGIFISDDGDTPGSQSSLTIGAHVTITGNSSASGGGGIWASTETVVTGATAQTVFGNTASDCNNFFHDPTCELN